MNNAVVKHSLPATIWQDIERLMNHTSPICFAHTVGKTTIKSIHKIPISDSSIKIPGWFAKHVQRGLETTMLLEDIDNHMKAPPLWKCAPNVMAYLSIWKIISSTVKPPKPKIVNVAFATFVSQRKKSLHAHKEEAHFTYIVPVFVPIFRKETFKNVQTSGVDDLEIMRYLPGDTFYHIKQILLFHRLPFR